MSNELEDIKKQLEGNTLAMGAVAEVLQKMDERLSKAEEAEEEENEKAMEKAAHEELAKSITSMVLSNLKKEDPDNKLGLDTDGSKADLQRLLHQDHRIQTSLSLLLLT